MDRRRRRFVPSSEGLEGRQLLSTSTTSANPRLQAPAGAHVDGTAASSQTVETKLQRIQGLPFFLGKLDRDNVVPQPTVANIQNDLRLLVGQLHPGDSSIVAAFNRDLRKAQPYLTIRPQDAAALNRDFGAVLVSAGARPEVVTDLQRQMTDLASFASTRRDPRIVATNDYATVLQLALESGRPLVAPTAPSLLGADHQGNKGKVRITHNSQPSLTGNYVPGTNIQIVDDANQTVLGTATVDPVTSVYSVKFAGRLPDGIYTVRVRAENSGYLSAPSPKLTFEVLTRSTPRK
jgi:hypothetical protein